MKNAKRLIPATPTPPSPPSSPSAPSSPKTPGMPQAPEPSADSSSDAGQPSIVAEIMKKIMGGGSRTNAAGSNGGGEGVRGQISQISAISGKQGPSAETIQRWIREFPLDKYRDENGVVRCPVPKEIRDKIMRRLKG